MALEFIKDIFSSIFNGKTADNKAASSLKEDDDVSVFSDYRADYPDDNSGVGRLYNSDIFNYSNNDGLKPEPPAESGVGRLPLEERTVVEVKRNLKDVYSGNLPALKAVNETFNEAKINLFNKIANDENIPRNIKQQLVDTINTISQTEKLADGYNLSLLSSNGNNNDIKQKIFEQKVKLYDLKNAKADLEAQINSMANGATKEALSRFNDVKASVDEIKNKKISEEEAKIDNLDVNTYDNLKIPYSAGKNFLKNELTGDARLLFPRLAESMGMHQDEAAEYIMNLCNTLGEGKLPPKVLLALMCQESEYNPSAEGDNGKAIGFGQMHKIAVEEVNNIYKTDFNPDTDRSDVFKSLDMIVLFLKHCIDSTDSLWGAVGMYNQGSSDKAYNTAATNYAQAVFGRL